MSTLKTTNIAHPSSASNNIVLDASGNVNIDSNTLYVDATNNRVGIGTTPSQALHVVGTANRTPIAFKGSGTGTGYLYADNTSFGVSTNSGNLGGTSAFVGVDSANHALFITSGTERARIDSSGRLLVGTSTTPNASVPGFLISADIVNVEAHKSSSGSTTANVSHFIFINGNGNIGSIATNGSATAYNTSSDYRLKENVTPVTDGIVRLQQLNPSRFNFKADPGHTVDGFIAHEAQSVVPECVTGAKDAVDADGNPVYQGIDQSKLVPLLTAALQEAVAKIEGLEVRLTAAGI